MTICVCCPCSKLSKQRCKFDNLLSHDLGILTTLAALAITSKSEGSAPRVVSTAEISDGDSSVMSRRHSVANDRIMDNVIKRALRRTISPTSPEVSDLLTLWSVYFPLELFDILL